MKRSVALIILVTLGLACIPFPSLAQTGKRANEEAHQRTEKIKERVAKLGSGQTANVELFDGKHFKGKISRTDDRSFDIVDKQNQTTTINFSDVSSVYRSAHVSSLQKGIIIGIAAAAAAVVIAVFASLCHNEPGSC